MPHNAVVEISLNENAIPGGFFLIKKNSICPAVIL